MVSKHIISRVNCPVCNSNDLKSIFKRSYNEEFIGKYMSVAYQGNADIGFLRSTNTDFEILKCNKCTLAFQKNVLQNDKLIELYDKWIDPKLAEEWRNNGDLFGITLTNLKILKFAKRYHKKAPSKITVLDYGAGLGDFLVLAKNMGFNSSYALEYSLERIRVLKDKGISVIDNNDHKSEFDLIVVNQVLEHLTDPVNTLKDIYSRLNNNGIAFFAVPNCPEIEQQLRRTINITDENELHRVLLDASVVAFQHINYFNNRNFKKMINNCGYEIVFNPYLEILNSEMSYKSILRPFYNYVFKTYFFVRKKNNAY